jgi:hypothetical protein
MARKNANEDTRSQRQKFMDAAREVGASEDPHAFRKAVRKVAGAPTQKEKKASGKSKQS